MRKLQSKPNVEPPSPGYPFGRIKDNPGNRTGTPVNESVYGDIHVVLDKLLSLANITPNDLPENEYSGYQIIEALFRRFLTSDKNLGIKHKVLVIPPWNMKDESLTMSVAHGLGDVSKILSAEAWVRNDAGNQRYNFMNCDSTGGTDLGDAGLMWGQIRYTSTNIVLTATAGIGFATSNVGLNVWQSKSFDRGFIYLTYKD